MKKILITGASGTIGRRLIERLFLRKDEVFVFTQNAQQAQSNLFGVRDIIKWDYRKPDEWEKKLNGIDAIVHLAGVNLASKRWNNEYKKIAYQSRVISTRNLVNAFLSVEQKPKVFICANAVGIYGDRFDEILDEKSFLGNDFLANLCKDWEKESEKLEKINVRRVSIRTSPVLIKGEGLLQQLYFPFKLFVGGPLAGGRQWFSWIHIDDIVGIYLHAIDNESVHGSINAASPGIVRMIDFARVFGKVLRRPSIFPIPKVAMKIVAGEVADYAVMSQRVSINKILQSGYKFKFEKLEEALTDLLK
jgi:uncharacterized protein